MRNLTRAFAPGLAGGPWQRVSRASTWLRIPLALGALSIAFVTRDAFGENRTGFFLLIGLVYVPLSFVAVIYRRSERAAYFIATLALDLSVVFLVMMYIPEVRQTALLGMLFIHTRAVAGGGRQAGVVTGLIAVILSTLAELLAPFGGITYFAIGFLGLLMAGNIILVDAAVRERTMSVKKHTQIELSSLSHELRTPLTAIGGFAQSLASNWDQLDAGTRAVMLERIEANSIELDQLIAHLIDYALSDDRRVELEARRLRESIEELLEARRPVLGAHPVTVDVPQSLWVQLDPFAFDRVMGNLLVNAAKYSPLSEPIAIVASLRGDQVVVEVRDRGPGIAPEDRERIFDPFFRAPGTGRVEGIGLGLALARRFAERSGGRLWVESEVGVGSTFCFTLRAATQSTVPLHPKSA